VQVAVRDQDHGHLEALARILDADDAVAQRLRSQIEQILAEDGRNSENTPALPRRGPTRH
jgi:hypothetical protein